jgi:hypothetical protein
MMSKWKVAGATFAGATAYFTIRQLASSNTEDGMMEDSEMLHYVPPSRAAMLADLRKGNFDLLIVGGGATGCGAALDAASRGNIRVACIDAGDWSSGTSSKSTKLVHGGVRYLEKAVKELDWQQYKLVKEALHERRTVLKME